MPPATSKQAPGLVCISHLWWDWVWQRPQHLMTRLAREFGVVYVEEPRIEIGPENEAFEIVADPSGVEVARLRLVSERETFWRRLDASRNELGGHPSVVSPDITEASLMFVETAARHRLKREVADLVTGRAQRPLVAWLYTPLAIDFIDVVRPDLIVFDVMDDLASFAQAPAGIREKTDELLRRADLVLAGGPSLQRSVAGRRPDAFLFPSGVDEAHFAAALDDDLPLPPELERVPRPIIGFLGVVDERSDLALLAAVARARPEWHFVMVGPLLKIEERSAPRVPNLHYVPRQPYAALPAFLKGFDVAMMPFALNEATRAISPTKTLEYMAAQRPIVSTPVPDVVELYSSAVRFATTPDEWVTQIERALGETRDGRTNRIARGRELLAANSWDRIATEVAGLIRQRLPAPAVSGADQHIVST